MKRVFLILATVLVFAAPALGESICVFIGAPPGGGAAEFCASCTGEADADVMCEGFEGTGYQCSSGWTETEGTGSINEDATHSGTLACTDKGSQALEIQLSTGTATYTRWDNGSEILEANLQWYFNVVSEALGDGQNFIMGKMQDGSNTDMAYWRLQQVSGQLQVLLRVKDSTDSWASATTYNVSTGTWYRFRIEWVDGAPGNYNAWLANADGTGETQILTNQSAYASWEFQKILHGSTTSEEGGTIQIDNQKIDDDTMPSGCAT